MSVPTSEVGYTSAMPGREDHEVHKEMRGHGGGGGVSFLYVENEDNMFIRNFGKLYQNIHPHV